MSWTSHPGGADASHVQCSPSAKRLNKNGAVRRPKGRTEALLGVVIPAPGETESHLCCGATGIMLKAPLRSLLIRTAPRPACLTASNMSVTAVYRRVALSAGMLSLTDF